MKKEFDFDKIGKRMPYTTPDGFFDKMEDDIWKKVKRKPIRLHLVMRSVIAVAASIALILIINNYLFKANPATINDVDRAFSQLSTDDQAYLLEIYQEDVFIDK